MRKIVGREGLPDNAGMSASKPSSKKPAPRGTGTAAKPSGPRSASASGPGARSSASRPAGAPSTGPSSRRQAAPTSSAPAAYVPRTPAPPEPWSDEDLERLQSLLDEVAQRSEPLDVSMLDGFLVGVILQPRPVALSAWWPWVLDSEEGQAPAGVDAQALLQLVQRRFTELRQAIADRQWFDPWVFEMDEEASPSDTVLPWVAGFALATDVFPGLMGLDESQLTEPLAQLYMHLDPDDLEDADALLEEIESLEPPEELDEAVESLVRASLLLADVSLPQAAPRPAGRGGPRSGGPRSGGPRSGGPHSGGPGRGPSPRGRR